MILMSEGNFKDFIKGASDPSQVRVAAFTVTREQENTERHPSGSLVFDVHSFLPPLCRRSTVFLLVRVNYSPKEDDFSSWLLDTGVQSNPGGCHSLQFNGTFIVSPGKMTSPLATRISNSAALRVVGMAYIRFLSGSFRMMAHSRFYLFVPRPTSRKIITSAIIS